MAERIEVLIFRNVTGQHLTIRQEHEPVLKLNGILELDIRDDRVVFEIVKQYVKAGIKFYKELRTKPNNPYDIEAELKVFEDFEMFIDHIEESRNAS